MRILFKDENIVKLEPVKWARQYKKDNETSIVEIGVESGLISLVGKTMELAGNIIIPLYKEGYVDLTEEDYGLLKPGGLI